MATTMRKRLIAGTVLTGGLVAAAVGVGSGWATADPGHPGPGPVVVQPQRPDVRPQDRDGYDRAVRDHRPFQYQGRWVNPIFDEGRHTWGFWLGPIWIPLV